VYNGKVVYKAKAVSDNVQSLCNTAEVPIVALDCYPTENITEFNFASAGGATCLSGHLEQLAIACPSCSLQRLSLENNYDCLRSLNGLRKVESLCHDLRGLNLKNIPVTSTENHLLLWEILSDMKLTHLALEKCVLQLQGIDDACEMQIVSAYQKCCSLKALQVELHTSNDLCPACKDSKINWSLLFHFQVLKYCRIVGDNLSIFQNVISSCKKLVVFSCYSNEHLLISSVMTSTLQQLSIESENTNIPDIFMETVSSHCGLIHVVLSVNSVSFDGIFCLIKNSRALLTLRIYARMIVHSKDSLRLDIKEQLGRKFSSRRLFNTDGFVVQHSFQQLHNLKFMQYETDFFPLWYCDYS